MESNHEFMILSFLNLYLTYMNVKSSKSKDVTSINRRQYITKPTKAEELSRTIRTRNTVPTVTGTQFDQVSSSNEQGERKTTINKIDQDTANQDANSNREINSSRFITTKKEKRTRKGRKRLNPNRKPRIRRWGVHPINRDWAITGYHRKVFSTIKKMDEEQFFMHTRMTKPTFDWLLSLTKTTLRKKKQRVGPEERLAITLNYLAYGTALQSIAWKHKLGKSTIRQIVLDTCEVLWNVLSPIYLSEPTTSQYGDVADGFNSMCGMPNCVGAIDSKRVSVRMPKKRKWAHKNEISNMLLTGVCDTKYKFMAVSVEYFDNSNDEGIFQLSPFGKALMSDQLPLPSSKSLSQSSPPFPHYFVTNKSLPLRRNVMCPYQEEDLDTTKTIFNKMISRACKFAENSFGILTARWRFLSTQIEFLPENCKTIILACFALHNYVMANDEKQLYCPENFVDRETDFGYMDAGEWRKELLNNGDEPLISTSANLGRSNYESNKLRDTLANYFANEVIWYVKENDIENESI